jgi:hypothetical protein
VKVLVAIALLPLFGMLAQQPVWSTKMMRAAVWASCGFAGQLVFMVQPVQHRRGNHTTTRGQAMAGGQWSDQRW